MNTINLRRFGGVSLIEVMIAVAILSVTVIGASGYRYYAVLDAKEADEHIAAARVALLLCESWRGTKGSTTFDPVTYFGSELPITADSGFSGFGDMGSSGLTFRTLGTYQVTLNSIDYHIVLSWADINPSLRALNVVIGRPKRSNRVTEAFYTRPCDSLDGRDSYMQGPAPVSPYDLPYSSPEEYKLFKLTTYTEI